jgi:low affinity Fe/Cu permease
MYWNEIKRISMAGGFISGVLTMAIKLLLGHALLASTYTAIIVIMSTSIILLLSLRMVGRVLAHFLMQKKMEAEALNQEEEVDEITRTKAKVQELRDKRQHAEEDTIRKFEERVSASKKTNEKENPPELNNEPEVA